MATNGIEKNAQALNKILREDGKKYGKIWRQRIRSLLSQTFAALNAKPLDGALCLRLQSLIESELASIENETVDVETPAALPDEAASAAKSRRISAEDSVPAQSARMDEGHSAPRTRIGKANSGQGEPRIEPMEPKGIQMGENSGAGDVPPTIPAKKNDEPGLFDLIRIQIRTFFTLRACVRPPYIGKFVTFADRYAEIVQERIDKFLNVLSKGDDNFKTNMEVEVGYREDLLPDMPDRNLVLSPKRKKRR